MKILVLLSVLILSTLFGQDLPQMIRVSNCPWAGYTPVKKVEPTYPPLAKTARVQGTVTFDALITKRGRVDMKKLILVSQSHPLLVKAARDSVKEWRYVPMKENGKAVPFLTYLQFYFVLSPAD